MLEQNRTGLSEAVVGQDVRPDGVLGIGRLGDDPEALFGVVNHRDRFAADRRDRPVFAEEVQGVIGIEFALEVEGQMEVQERPGGAGAMVVALFLQGQFPGGVGGQAGGAADVVLVVPVDLRAEQWVGLFVVGNFFVGQQTDEAFLEGVEAALDFAFGLGVGGDAVGGAQGREGALELGVQFVEPMGSTSQPEPSVP